MRQRRPPLKLRCQLAQIRQVIARQVPGFFEQLHCFFGTVFPGNSFGLYSQSRLSSGPLCLASCYQLIDLVSPPDLNRLILLQVFQ